MPFPEILNRGPQWGGNGITLAKTLKINTITKARKAPNYVQMEGLIKYPAKDMKSNMRTLQVTKY